MKQKIRFIKEKDIAAVAPECAPLPRIIEAAARNVAGFYDGTLSNAAVPFVAWHLKQSWLQKRPSLGLDYTQKVDHDPREKELISEFARKLSEFDKEWCYFYKGSLVLIHKISWEAILSIYVALSSMGYCNWRELVEHFEWEETDSRLNLWSEQCI